MVLWVAATLLGILGYAAYRSKRATLSLRLIGAASVPSAFLSGVILFPWNRADARRDGEAVTATSNDEARGEIDDHRTATSSEGLPIGAGDVIQTRKNNTSIGVANRQNGIVQHVEQDGALRVR